ncbi:hypothetical protein [Streptomyces sp. S.PNR 29]|uniref:hypothetical protein n=1 Tax=Streptomyces sp. S.PNR 29 TaxID=2973805 RepID=UPI0025AFC64E|nr:hypothetical protein [Streptomyces sp. S.PNR 29]MDN0195685.1 hypothetical protein [Streptomyces sp. S.PNR 29]
MGSEPHVCPVCGQPVETVVRRHKTLGAWVPVWVAGPCRNPECEAFGEEGVEGAAGVVGPEGTEPDARRGSAERRKTTAENA